MHTQSLNLGSLGVWLLLRILGLNFPPNDKFPDIVLLCQVEEFANLAGSLGSKTFGVGDIGDTRDIVVALLDNNDRKDRKIRTDDATTDRLALAFAGTTGTVARVALGKEKTHTCGMENTLLSENLTGQ
jgi:hypothetical protein